MVDFDFTPIWAAVIAFNLYYVSQKIFAKCHSIENGKRGIVEIWLTDSHDNEEWVDSFVIPVAGIESVIDYGDYIRNRLEKLGRLPER